MPDKQHIALVVRSYLTLEGLQRCLHAYANLEVHEYTGDIQNIGSFCREKNIDILLIEADSLPKDFVGLINECRQEKRKLAGLTDVNSSTQLISHFDIVLDIHAESEEVKTFFDRLINFYPGPQNSDTFMLSEREKEILRLVAKGKTNNEIAESLFISAHTVMTHRKNITRKLGIKTVSGLTVYALINRLIIMEEIN